MAALGAAAAHHRAKPQSPGVTGDKGLGKKNQVLDKFRTDESKLREQITGLETTVEVIREEREQLRRKLDARQNEYNLTKSRVDNLEGFPEAVKVLKK